MAGVLRSVGRRRSNRHGRREPRRSARPGRGLPHLFRLLRGALEGTLEYGIPSHFSVLEDDGSVRWVVAHHDPGVPNWLDTAGHQRGTVGVRWVGPEVVDVLPDTRVVKLSDLT